MGEETFTETVVREALKDMISAPAVDTAVERMRQESQNPGSLGYSDDELKGTARDEEPEGVRLDESKLG